MTKGILLKTHFEKIAFETQSRRYQKSKTGVSVASQKGLMSSKIYEKCISQCIIEQRSLLTFWKDVTFLFFIFF